MVKGKDTTDVVSLDTRKEVILREEKRSARYRNDRGVKRGERKRIEEDKGSTIDDMHFF